jgi:hypothetical protein
MLNLILKSQIFAQRVERRLDLLAGITIYSALRCPAPHHLVVVTRFELMSNGKNQHDILRGKPAILGHVAKLAARKDQFPTSVLSFAAQQGMVGEQLEGSSYTYHPLPCELRVVICEKIEEPLEVGKRSGRYFDPRHARALGRRADFPATRASR